jgi:3-dehydroquinate dehydratase/shikimate dehydrogenase
MAVSWGHLDLVRCLVEHGDDPTTHDDNGQTSRQSAASGLTKMKQAPPTPERATRTAIIGWPDAGRHRLAGFARGLTGRVGCSVPGQSLSIAGMDTRLCLPVLVHDAQAPTLEAALARAAAGRTAGAALVEWRVDRLAGLGQIGLEAVARLVAESPMPCVVTCRRADEGGQFEGGAGELLAVWGAAVSASPGPAYLDVELATLQDPAAGPRLRAWLDQALADGQTRLILSTHDFSGRPADLLGRVSAMVDEPLCRVMKLVWMARTVRDNLQAFELLEARHKPTVALCMGEHGLMSRVLQRKFGGVLSFGTLAADAGAIGEDDAGPASRTAPGQVSIEAMRRVYRWDVLGAETAVYAVIGHPVGHSMSPAIHNAGLSAVDHDGVYLPLDIAPGYEPLKATLLEMLAMPGLNFRGASVTIPHKHDLLRFVREQGGAIDELTDRIGVANTLTVTEGGSLHAMNTDYAAALDAVAEVWGGGPDAVAGRSVMVLGAGGAARAVVAAFAHHGARVTIYNRSVERAQTLADEFHATAAGVEALAKLSKEGRADVIINTTPLGMHPHVDASPLPGDFRAWGQGTVVFDTVYNPPKTQLLQRAQDAGCVTIAGSEMFVRQAAGQFEAWTGQPAPLEVFRRVVAERLPA